MIYQSSEVQERANVLKTIAESVAIIKGVQLTKEESDKLMEKALGLLDLVSVE